MEINELPLIRESLFTSMLKNIDNDLLISELESYYLSVLNKSTSDTEGSFFPSAGPMTEMLNREITSVINKVSDKEMFCREFWMYSMTEASSAIPRHNHKTNKQLYPSEYYSFAYYPCAEEDAANIYFVANYCNTIDCGVRIKPVSSMLIVFHSYVDHYTDRHNSLNKRTCISGNYWPINPDKSTSSDWSKFLDSDDKNSKVSKFS